MTKGNESVRFVWYEDLSQVLVSETDGEREGRGNESLSMTRERARERWTALEADGFTPIMLTGKDDYFGNRLGTLPDGREVTEFPGGGWVLHVPGTPNLYNIVE
jgi:hypothetical protein